MTTVEFPKSFKMAYGFGTEHHCENSTFETVAEALEYEFDLMGGDDIVEDIVDTCPMEVIAFSDPEGQEDDEGGAEIERVTLSAEQVESILRKHVPEWFEP